MPVADSETTMIANAISAADRLRALLDVARLVRREEDVPTVLDGIARIVSETLEFGVVAIHLYRPEWDDFCVTTVYGPKSVQRELLGSVRTRQSWTPMLKASYLHRGAFLVRSAADDLWQHGDALLVAMEDAHGRPLGILAVDEPASGRRPDDDDVDVLVAVAVHGALALESAQESVTTASHRASLEHLFGVSSQLHGARSPAAALQAVCDGIRSALGFQNVALELLAEDGETFQPSAAAGWELDDPALQTTLTRSDLLALLHPAPPADGCLLLSTDEVLLRLGADPRTYRSKLNGAAPRAWDNHWLLVPLRTRGGDLRGFIWADDPIDRLQPSASRRQALGLFAAQATSALDAASQVEAVRSTRDTLQALVDASPLAIFGLDTDALVTSWSASAERIFGWSADEVVGRPIPIVPEEDLGQARELRRRVLTGETLIGLEVRRVRRDGTSVDLTLSLAPVPNAQGGLDGYVAIAADVTEKVEAEQAASASAARERSLLNAALDGVLTLDRDGRVLEFNPVAEELFGWLRDEVTGADPADLLIAPADREAVREGLRAAVETGSGSLLRRQTELVGLRADGREFPMEFALSRVAVPDGPVFTVFVRDLTGRRRREEALRHAEAKYRTLVENLPLASYINALGNPIRTTYMSPQIEPLLGYAPEEWLADGFFTSVLHPDDRDRIFEVIKRTHETGEPFREEFRFVARDGSVVWVLDQTTAVLDTENRPLFLQGFILDITRRKLAQEGQRQSEEINRLIAEHTLELITLLDLDGRVLYASPASETILEVEAGELQGRQLNDLVHPDDLEGIGDHLDRAIADGTTGSITVRIRRGGGTWALLEGTASAIVDADGRPTMILAVSRYVGDAVNALGAVA
jgi:PAS domain S-box-containing protein